MALIAKASLRLFRRPSAALKWTRARHSAIHRFSPRANPFSSMSFHGTITALVTPFTPDAKSVDYEALQSLVEWQIQAGVDGLLVMGSTGENTTVTTAEREKVIERVIQFTNKRVPVMAGTGSSSTTEAVRLTQAAKDAGADGCLVVCPAYVRPSQSGLYEHFKAVAAVGLPVVLYNNPARSGVALSADTIVALAKLPNIAAYKDATGTLALVNEVAARCDLTLLAGEDNLAMAMMSSLGAKGVTSVVSNVAPERVLAITRACANGDYAAARKAHLDNVLLVQSIFLDPNPVPTKKMLELMGKCSAAVRLPLMSCTPETTEVLKKQLQLLTLQ